MFGFSAGMGGGRGPIFFSQRPNFSARLAGKFCQELATLRIMFGFSAGTEGRGRIFFFSAAKFFRRRTGRKVLPSVGNTDHEYHVSFLCQVPEVGAQILFLSGQIFPPDRPESFAKRWQHCSIMFGLVLSARYRRTDEERVRCFLVKETKRGIQVAQSSSPSCHTDLHSSLAAHRTFKAQPHKDPPAKDLIFLCDGMKGEVDQYWILF
jgi:hypothetical protein